MRNGTKPVGEYPIQCRLEQGYKLSIFLTATSMTPREQVTIRGQEGLDNGG